MAPGGGSCIDSGAYDDFFDWPGEVMQWGFNISAAENTTVEALEFFGSGSDTPSASETFQNLTTSCTTPAETSPDDEPPPVILESDLFPSHVSHGDAAVINSKTVYATPSCSSSQALPLISTSLSVEVPECVLLTPRSCYDPFEPPDGAPIMSERSAFKLLSKALGNSNYQKTGEFTEFRLDDFAVYCDTDKFPEEMRSFNHLDTKTRHSKFFFDGVLSVGDTKAYVRRIPVIAVPIGNYGSLSVHTVRGHIWLQSSFNSNSEIYYRLGRPAREYARFFSPFLWVADLAKHFVDYLKVMGDNKRKVTIHHFRSTFSTWVRKTHKKAPEFLEWLAHHPSEDYRTSVVANIAFLHKETVGVLGSDSTYYHTIWAEAWEFKRYPNPPKDPSPNPPTVVTQYIYDCFKHLPFGDRLEVVPLASKTEKLRNHLIQQRHLEMPFTLHSSAKAISTAPDQRIRGIKPGDTISTHRDGEGSGTEWQREVSKGFSDADRWFALVQKVHTKSNGRRVFDVIWYYRPVDTLCGLMKYPWNNELFLSSHCSCSENSKIKESDVLGVHDVDFGGISATKAEFFCRQTYIHEDRRWITLKSDHLRCGHMQLSSPQGIAPKCRRGDTFLVHTDLNSPFSEPCEFLASFREGGSKFYRFRRLLRRKLVDSNAPNARPNEVVYSKQFIEVKEKQILAPCYIRFFTKRGHIPTPYDRNGVGSFFYMTHQEVLADGVPRYVPLKETPPSLRQGYDPTEEIPKLRGIDLFCGGGNFGRGLEDGGGIEMKWANDCNSSAIHSYMANVQNPDNFHPYLGSIDDLQRLAMQGRFAKNVPRIGDIDFIAGGSPCPGFSCLTNDKTTMAQRKNQSLVAAFASFVDLYRPKYGLLENVPGIVHKKADRDQDVFSQLICALVGLGYQTQFLFLDASSCGSPQRRSRVFVIFAAPGFELPQKPTQTHFHPPRTRSLRIGWLPNGQHMATREMSEVTPFKYVTAEEATADLPSVYDAKPDTCIPYPDHRVAMGLTRALRSRISLIPTRPWGMNFAQAWYGENRKKAGSGVMTAAEREFFPGADSAMNTKGKPMPMMLSMQSNSNSHGRLFPHLPLDTIVTRQGPGDAKNGRQLHWRENRVLTVMEARRAQGLRDEEVIIGDPTTQYRIVGNSVAREVALALGVVIREAWVTSLRRDHEESISSIALHSEMTDIETRVTTGRDNGIATSPVMDTDGDISILGANPSSSDLALLIDRYAMPVPVTTNTRCSPSVASTTTSTRSPTPGQADEASPSRKRSVNSGCLAVEVPGPYKRQKTETGESSRQRGGSHGILRPSSLGRDVITLDNDD